MKHPDLIDEVFVFSFPTKHSIGHETVANLSVAKKVRKFTGIHMATILEHFNKQPSMPLLLSHQILHGWNYVYYEMLHFGLPWVHNSEWFQEYGYAYEGMDIEGGTRAVLKAVELHPSTYKEKQAANDALLATMDPANVDTVRTWDMLLRKSHARCTAAAKEIQKLPNV
jgi:hypothetical protein